MVSQDQDYVAELEGSDWARESDGKWVWRFTYKDGKWKAFCFDENKAYPLNIGWHEDSQKWRFWVTGKQVCYLAESGDKYTCVAGTWVKK